MEEHSEEKNDEETDLQVSPEFLSSPWYKYIVYVLQHLQHPNYMNKARGVLLKMRQNKL